MHVDVFHWLPALSLKAMLADLIARLPGRRITVGRVSADWRREHERDAGKR